MTRPCMAGTTATLAPPVLSESTTTSVCSLRNARSSPKDAPPRFPPAHPHTPSAGLTPYTSLSQPVAIG
jgi:hypothetical protein